MTFIHTRLPTSCQGGCLVPKRAMDVMKGEVARLLQLADHSIVPITWKVPRKSYDKFHADIFPDTPGPVASMGPTEWMGGDNEPPAKLSLDPAKRSGDVTVFSTSLSGKTFSHPSATLTDSQAEKIQPKKTLSIKRKEPLKLRENNDDEVDGASLLSGESDATETESSGITCPGRADMGWVRGWA